MSPVASEVSQVATGTSSDAVKRIRKAGVLKIHVRGELGGKDHKEKEKKSQGKASKYPRLSRFLYSLLEDAGFNQLSLDQVDVRDTYHKLRQAAKKYKLEKNIEASELFSAIPELLKKPLFKGFTSAFGNILS